MSKVHPRRLMNDQYMKTDSPLRAFRNRIEQAFDLHWHEFYELCLILDGSGVHTLNGTTTTLGPGSLFLLTPADLHAIAPKPGSYLTMYHVIFSEAYMAEEVRGVLFQPSMVFTADLEEDAMQAWIRDLEDLVVESALLQKGCEVMLRSTLARILVRFSRTCEAPVPSTPNDSGAPNSSVSPNMRRSMQLIQHRFRDPLTLRDVAKEAGLSPNYYSEVFHALNGISFQLYLQGLRLQFAHTLISMTSLTVTEICYASGFHTLTHFLRAFKNKFGLTPSRLRELETRTGS